MRLLVLALLALPAFAQFNYLNHGKPLLDAHNCYPYKGQYKNRIDRALSTGFPVGIEQDLAWYVDPTTGKGRIVVSHSDEPTGTEPTLRDYFFERVRPIVEKALKENNRSQWPLIVVHFDFKSNQAPLLHAVWNLLGEYEGWITTAVKTSDPHHLSPFDPKPLLVLTEVPDEQEEVFFNEVPVGARLRLFGSAHSKDLSAEPEAQREHDLATLPPAQLLPERPTNYRRWWNNSWHEVEEGGQRAAGGWTAADDQRLTSLVDYAHKLGYWIRFYTLDGFTPAESQGYDKSYNFGSKAAVAARWKAAMAAGVDIIATDQVEDLRAAMK